MLSIYIGISLRTSMSLANTMIKLIIYIYRVSDFGAMADWGREVFICRFHFQRFLPLGVWHLGLILFARLSNQKDILPNLTWVVEQVNFFGVCLYFQSFECHYKILVFCISNRHSLTIHFRARRSPKAFAFAIWSNSWAILAFYHRHQKKMHQFPSILCATEQNASC